MVLEVFYYAVSGILYYVSNTVNGKRMLNEFGVLHPLGEEPITALVYMDLMIFLI